jgi:hypothetical protein
MKLSVRSACGLFTLAALGVAQAQDSISKNGCLPGDALDPYQDASSPLGSEQRNDYVVDLAPVVSSWGNSFVVGPLAKTGVVNPGFFTNFMTAQAMSRKLEKVTTFASPSYALWSAAPGVGINSDPSKNVAPTTFVAGGARKGLQFAAAFGENDITLNDSEYLGIVTTVVNVDPEEPGRLYVSRIQSAVNGCDDTTEHATLYMGGVDTRGNTIFRADDFGQLLVGCGLNAIVGNNLFLVDALARNGNVRNVVSNDFPGGLFDVAPTQWLVRNSSTAFNTPSLIGETATTPPFYIGSNFATQFARGAAFGAIAADSTHLPAGVADHRGNLSYLGKQFALLGSSRGLAALLGHDGNGDATRLVVFGLDTAGNVSGTLALVLPPVVVDNSTGFANFAGINEFDHYHSQVAFQGGNGQIAMNLDANGDLLVAAQVTHPSYLAPNDGTNYIAVCRVDAATGSQSWTMAGYNDGFGGKFLLTGIGGSPVGQMVPMNLVTTLVGPSVSAPMIDGAGNVWFLSAIEMFDGSGFSTGLVRAVYDAATFSYELELVTKVGDVVAGKNSGRNYRVSSLRIADSNSVDSGTAWSNNISEDGFMGIDGTSFDPSDPRATGGLVVQAVLIYDVDENGIYDPCDSAFTSPDESYRVLFYVGADGTTGVDTYGQGCAGSGNFTPSLTLDGLPKAGKPVTLTIDGALAGQQAVLFFGLAPASIPVAGPCSLLVQPLLPITLNLPLLGAPGPGNGGISVPVIVPASIPAGVGVTLQAFCSDPGVTRGFSNTNGLALLFQ